MSFSNRGARVRRSMVAALMIGVMTLSLSPCQAEAAGSYTRLALDSAASLLRTLNKRDERTAPRIKPRQIQSAGEREARVTRISLCPRRLLMYSGEEHVLSPIPLDKSAEPVHGVVFRYDSSNTVIAEVDSDGTVKALKAGQCLVTASTGQKRAQVKVEVRDGARPRLGNAQWDLEHENDCKNPEEDPVFSTSGAETQSKGNGGTKPPVRVQLLPPPDPDEPPITPEAPAPKNTVGHPRFRPNLGLQMATETDNQLGSSSFNLTIPIYGADGRGVGVDLNLVYNSRLWTKNAGTIAFDYDTGWPAPGFRLNYGRIIRDYNFAGGDYLLVEADGTRTPLINQGNTLYRSTDGRYLEFLAGTTNKLFLPNGMTVFYDTNGSKLVPVQTRDIHGNSISMTYVTSCADAFRTEACDCNNGCFRPPRQSLKQVSDTLGRFVTFYYDASGHLAEVRVPGYNGSADRVAAKFSYQTITLAYNFGSLGVLGVPSGGQLDVLTRVYFPDTGRGYVFDSYSGYGMLTHASMRLGMTDASNGTEVAYTEYTFQTSGTLEDSPQYTERREWWQGKTDDAGTPVTSPAVFSYSRTTDDVALTMTNTVAGPAGPNSLTTVMVSNNDSSSEQFGLLTEQRIESPPGTVKLKTEFFYDSPSSVGGLQRNRILITDDGSPANQTRTDSVYGQYGRLLETIEYGFPTSGSFKKRRRTVYTYLDTADYINLALYHLVTDITVYDAKQTNTITDDTPIARSGFVYDTFDPGFELTTYGFTKNCAPDTNPPCTPPPGFTTKFVDRTARGLVSTVRFWSDATAANPQDSFRHAYDIFGNELKGEVSCCSLKRFTFSPNAAGLFYSAPLSAIDGPESGPNLVTSFAFDLNTGFLNSQTDSNNLVTSYTPDAAMRLRTVTYPKLAGDANPNPMLETFFADPNYTKDGLTYQSRFIYFDGSTQKVQITNRWMDGVGRVLRTGSGSGFAPSSFDVVKTIYDDMGRPRKTTNPYNTVNSDGDTTGLPNSTVYAYDGLSRLVSVTFADSNTVTTSYSGALTTATDQAGRQRRSEDDGLGRRIKVTEMDSSAQLTLDTTYGYDLNDNLTSINQGGQTRAYKYDSLSRMTFQRSPEQDATISDGSDTWSAKYTYTSFGAIATREDARRAISTYSYDGLNRLYRVQYALPSPNPQNVQPTATVDVTYGSAVPKLGQVTEIKQTDSQSNTPWKEVYDYDGLSKVINRTISFDNQANSYTTTYGYNQVGQLTQITYPSNRVVKSGFDNRGRLQTVGDASLATKYISSIGYAPSQQISSIGLGNGVSESYGYSPERMQITSQSAIKGGNTLMNFTYNYVADRSRSGGVGTGTANTGQVMDITGSVKDPSNNTLQRNESYNYDQVARLAQSSGFYAQRNYAYDRWGNRTGVSGGQSQTVAIQQSGSAPTNRIASVNGVNYNYDSNGNETGDGAHSYLYDCENRITGIDSGSTATYAYDSLNRRVKKVAGTTTTFYIWEGSNVIAEYSNATAGSGGTRFYHPDRLSNRLVTDGAGVVKGTMDNLPFGDNGGVIGESEKHRFTNYERDGESGTDYAVNRQYAVTVGRFMRPDPVGGSLANPQSFNRYSYVVNDPVNLYDPVGLYKACVHQAMTQFLAKLAGLGDNVAAQLGRFAGGQKGGADSFRYSATNPFNAAVGILSWLVGADFGPSATIHFASEERIAQGKRRFSRQIASGDLRSAGFLLHSIEDVHGAHQDFHLPLGHAIASITGKDPDGVIGDQKFLNVSNEVYQLMTGDPNSKLTPEQTTALMNAIFETCAKQNAAKSLTRPRTVGGGGGGGGGGFGGGFGGYPWWLFALQDFLNWLRSIPVGGGEKEEDHLA